MAVDAADLADWFAAENDNPTVKEENKKNEVFGFGGPALQKTSIKWSDCRDLVLVPKGDHYKIRCLQESHPAYCWQYTTSRLLIAYHFDCARFFEFERANQRVVDDRPVIYQSTSVDASDVPPFYAYINDKYSPVEFSVQPKPLDGHRERLERLLNATQPPINDQDTSVETSCEDTLGLKVDQVFNGVPCAAWDPMAAIWRRARVRDLPDECCVSQLECIPIEYVDWGGRSFAKLRHLRPLSMRFGRLPPLSIRCKMHGVSINDLELDRCDLFVQMLDDLDNTVRVELVDCSEEEPFKVHLWHPTVSGVNLGTKFYPDPRTRGERVRPEKPYEPEFDEDDQSTCSSDDDSRPPEPKYLKSFDRLPKPPTGKRAMLDVTIVHIENARLVYLKTPDQQRCEAAMQKRLNERTEQLLTHPLKASHIQPELACLYRTPDDTWQRAMVLECDASNQCYTRIQLVDEGQVVGTSVDRLYRLPRDCDVAPLVFVGRLADFHDSHPHVGVTKLMRKLWMHQPFMFQALFTKRHHGPPFQLDLFRYQENINSWVSCNTELDMEIRRHRILVTKELVPYDPVVSARALLPLDTQFVYRLHVHQALLKGRPQYTHDDDE